MNLLSGLCGLIVGVANSRSLACAIAQAAHHAGAEIALSYQNDRFSKHVHKIGKELNAAFVSACDVNNDEEIAALGEQVEKQWGRLDFLVHAVAFAKREELSGDFLATSRDGFRLALDTSVYSLVGLTRCLTPMLKLGVGAPSVLTLSYLGGERAVPNYNVMGVAKAALEAAVRYLACDLGPYGIRVNALSPGPVRTLSAAGVSGLRDLMGFIEHAAPLRRNIDAQDVGDAAVFALSSLSRGVTAEVIHVDGGYSKTGVPPFTI
ncbi:MAG: enoyl-ACP reductase [Deltaproteobacteria bacterium]|nr:enoyl-ACP reductase [Deltaproteobacteria bacterium]